MVKGNFLCVGTLYWMGLRRTDGNRGGLFKVFTCGAILGGITGTWELTRWCGAITGGRFTIPFGDEKNNREMDLKEFSCVMKVKLRQNIVVEHEGWRDTTDQANWSFSDPRVQRIGPWTDLTAGLMTDQVQKCLTLLKPAQESVAVGYA